MRQARDWFARNCQSSAATQTYTFTFTDTAGWADLVVLNVLINNAIDGRQAC